MAGGSLGLNESGRWRYPEGPEGGHEKEEADNGGPLRPPLSDSSDTDSDEEDSGSREDLESSLKIKVQQHGSNLHLPLLPFNPLPRRPTLTFTPAPPLTPSGHEEDEASSYSYSGQTFSQSLPTPALSSSSLSGFNFAYSRSSVELIRNGENVQEVTTTVTNARRVTGKEIRQLARGMIPTLIGIAVAFLCSFGIVVGLIRGLPM